MKSLYGIGIVPVKLNDVNVAIYKVRIIYRIFVWLDNDVLERPVPVCGTIKHASVYIFNIFPTFTTSSIDLQQKSSRQNSKLTTSSRTRTHRQPAKHSQRETADNR